MDCSGIGVVRHGSYYVQVAGGGTQQVAAQVTKGNEGITKETERLPHQVEDTLVLLSLLQRTVGETGRRENETGLETGRETAETAGDTGSRGSETERRGK